MREAPVHILIADDHIDTLEVYARLLAEPSRTFSKAAGYQQAMASAKTQTPDLLVADLHFSDGDGCSLLGALRQEVNPHIKGIVVTGSGVDADRGKCQQAGFLTLLLKPVLLDTLSAAVDAALAIRSQLESSHSSTPTSHSG